MKPTAEKAAVKKPAAKEVKVAAESVLTTKQMPVVRPSLPWVERAIQEMLADALAGAETYFSVGNLATLYAQYQIQTAQVAARRLERMRIRVTIHALQVVDAVDTLKFSRLQAKFEGERDAAKNEKARKALFLVYQDEQQVLSAAHDRATARALKPWGIPERGQL